MLMVIAHALSLNATAAALCAHPHNCQLPPRPPPETGMLSKVPPETSGRQQTALAVPRQNLLLSLMFRLITTDFSCVEGCATEEVMQRGTQELQEGWLHTHHQAEPGPLAQTPKPGGWEMDSARNIPVPPIPPFAQPTRPPEYRMASKHS